MIINLDNSKLLIRKLINTFFAHHLYSVNWEENKETEKEMEKRESVNTVALRDRI